MGEGRGGGGGGLRMEEGTTLHIVKFIKYVVLSVTYFVISINVSL